MDLDDAWAAGFFDGEGSVGCYRNTVGTSSILKMAIVSSDLASLEEFRRIVGVGSICERRVTSPLTKKRIFVWQASGIEAGLQVREHLVPHMRVKAVALQDALQEAVQASHTPRHRTSEVLAILGL